MPSREYLPPWTIQLTGLLAFVFFFALWGITERPPNPLLLTAAGGLLAGGSAKQARDTLRKLLGPDDDPPEPAKEAPRG